MNLCIVVIAYNRKESLFRCLSSIGKLKICSLIANVDLIVSIDYSNDFTQSELVKISECVKWKMGEKRIIAQKSRLGLRNHVISCGDLVDQYDALIMIEDDILISPSSLFYVSSVIVKLGNCVHIGGISLYTPALSEMAEMPFRPFLGSVDTFLIQTSQSWGQCWTKTMWHSFKDWYIRCNYLIKSNDMPDCVYRWPDSSWKKYFNKYIVERDLYFVYPRESYSTNYTDVGTHNGAHSNFMQVPLSINEYFRVGDFEEMQKFDAFMEPIFIFNKLPVYSDFYGYERLLRGPCYLLTSRIADSVLLFEYCDRMKPQYLSFILGVCGKGVRLYKVENELLMRRRSPRRLPGMHVAASENIMHWKYLLIVGVMGMLKWLLHKPMSFINKRIILKIFKF